MGSVKWWRWIRQWVVVGGVDASSHSHSNSERDRAGTHDLARVYEAR